MRIARDGRAARRARGVENDGWKAIGDGVMSATIAHGTPAARVPGWAELFLVTLAAVVVMNLLHEAGHLLAIKALGYEAVARINSVSLAGDTAAYRTVSDRMLADAAGPLVTIVIALVAWAQGMRGRWTYAPTIVGVAFAMRLIAAAVSFGQPNDEARISMALGLGPWVVFAVVLVLLGAMFVTLFRRRGLGWRWALVSYLAASIGFAAIVFGEGALPALSV